MRNQDFDQFTRLLAQGTSRRGLLKSVVTGAAGSLLALVGYKSNGQAFAKAMPAATAGAAQAVTPVVLTSTVAQSGLNQTIGSGPLPLTGLAYDFAGQEFSSLMTIDSISVTMTLTDADSAPGDLDFDKLTLGLGGVNTGIVLNGFPDSRIETRTITDVPRDPITRLPSPAVAAAIVAALRFNGRLVGSIFSTDNPSFNQISIPATADTTLIITGQGGAPPIITCSDDNVTEESLNAADAALQAGAEYVQLSPRGCFAYRRKLNSRGTPVYDAVLVQGRPSLVWIHTATESRGKHDADLDGFAEWQSVVTRGATISDEQRQVTEYSPITRLLIRRETYTRTEDILHVLWEEADRTTGTLRTVAQFDTSVFLAAARKGARPNTYRPSVAPDSFGFCSAAEEELLRMRLQEAVTQGVICFSDNQRRDLADAVLHALHRGVRFSCRGLTDPRTGEPVAAMLGDDWDDPTKRLEIVVNDDEDSDAYFFLDGTAEYQRSTLWHELLHTRFGPHREGLEHGQPGHNDFDRVKACESLCFDPLNANQCQCARCLNTTICDGRCSSLVPCGNPVGGAICPCSRGPNAFKYFPTCTECLVTCPSGLACFGISICWEIDLSCSPVPCRRSTA